MEKFKKSLLWLLLTGFFLVTFYFWWKNSGELFYTGSWIDALYALARLFGLLAVNLVLTQLILIGRVKWVEKLFGLDKLSLVHHYNGLFTLIFLLAHPVFMILVYAKFSQQSFLGQWWAFVSNSGELLNAFLAFCLFLVIVPLSLIIVRKRLKYESWYFTHLLTYLAIYLSFGHQMALGHDFTDRIFRAYWYGLYLFGFGNLIYFRFLRPLWFFYRHQFYVERIEAENEEVTSIYIKGRNLAKFKIEAGQFMIFRFLAKGFWWQAHPFSLSCSPNQDYLRISVKALGDFTSMVKNLPLGTKIIIDGPHGIFTDKKDQSQKYLLIAGGIGITPIRSLGETLAKEQKDVVMLYGNKSAKTLTFKDELDNLAGAQKLKLHYIISNDNSWKGEQGQIDLDKIQKLVPDFKERQIYLCGPRPMMKSIIGLLKKIGLKRSQIFFEKFSLGD